MTGDEEISCADGTNDGLHVKLDGRQGLVITSDEATQMRQKISLMIELFYMNMKRENNS